MISESEENLNNINENMALQNIAKLDSKSKPLKEALKRPILMVLKWRIELKEGKGWKVRRRLI